jgi:hypothetical protein
MLRNETLPFPDPPNWGDCLNGELIFRAADQRDSRKFNGAADRFTCQIFGSFVQKAVVRLPAALDPYMTPSGD